MTTEQYSIGYDQGYQDGMNDALAPQPVKQEQAEQEPVAEVVLRKQSVGFGRTEERKDIQFLADVDVGTKLYAKPQQQEEQEPVVWTYTRKGIYDKLTELGASIAKSCCNVPDKRCGADEWVLQTVQIELLLDALATPVRTKDLTDDEAQKLWNDTSSIVPMWAHHLHFARAIIAADREKNRA